MRKMRLEIAILALVLAPFVGYAITYLSSGDVAPAATAQGATVPAASVAAAKSGS